MLTAGDKAIYTIVEMAASPKYHRYYRHECTVVEVCNTKAWVKFQSRFGGPIRRLVDISKLSKVTDAEVLQ